MKNLLDEAHLYIDALKVVTWGKRQAGQGAGPRSARAMPIGAVLYMSRVHSANEVLQARQIEFAMERQRLHVLLR